MNRMQEFDNQFRELSTKLIREYEGKLKSAKERQKQADLKQNEKNGFKAAMLSAGLNISHLENLSKNQDEELKRWIADIRPKLVERSNRSETIKHHNIYYSIMEETSSKLLKPYASLLLAPDMKLLEGIDGEKGNPWVLPDNPDEVRIKQFNAGTGWDCEAQAGLPGATAYVQYPFIPNVSGLWDLSAFLGYTGFYIMRVHRNPWDCKSAQVIGDVNIWAFQYSWQGPGNTNMIDRSETNIDLIQLIDAPGIVPELTAIFQAGDPVSIFVEISLNTHVMGDGSYAEINFADGNANFINPGFVVARPPS